MMKELKSPEDLSQVFFFFCLLIRKEINSLFTAAKTPKWKHQLLH